MEHFVYNSPEFKNYLKKESHVRGEIKFLQSIVEKGMKVIDIGANIGITTVIIAKKIGAKGKVYSFEPVTRYFNVLKKNLSSNKLKNIEILKLAVSNQVGRTNFYDNGDASSVVPQRGIKKFEVSTTTIDIFLEQKRMKKIDLINMDCEGGELLVLKGAKETLRRNKIKIFCEIHHDFLNRLHQSVQDIVKYLKGINFKVHSVRLDDLSLRNNFRNCEYIYAYN